MKIVLLWTGRGLRPESVEELRANMGLIDLDEVCLIAWQPSSLPLPVSRHLVIGLHRRAGRSLATDQRVELRHLTPMPVDEVTGIDEVPAVDDATATEGAPDAATAALATAANRTAHLPVLHPSRVRQALVWRARRVKRTASRRVKRHPLFRVVRNQRSSRTALGFATGCLLARKVHDMARDADLVVGLDTASHRGAWALAQKVPGPPVVIGVPAAKRLLEQHQLAGRTAPDRD